MRKKLCTVRQERRRINKATKKNWTILHVHSTFLLFIYLFFAHFNTTWIGDFNVERARPGEKFVPV